MISSTRKDKKVPPKPDKFPCLMHNAADDVVILMTEEGKGMIVHGKGTDKYNTAGNYLGGWLMGYFKPYEGKIVLENK